MLTSCLKSSKLDEPLANAGNKRVGQRNEKILSPQKKSLSFASASTASTNDSFFFRQSSLEVVTNVKDNAHKLEDHAFSHLSESSAVHPPNKPPNCGSPDIR